MHLASSRSQWWYGAPATSRSSWSSQRSLFPPHEQGLAAVVGGAMVVVVAAVWSRIFSSSMNSGSQGWAGAWLSITVMGSVGVIVVVVPRPRRSSLPVVRRSLSCPSSAASTHPAGGCSRRWWQVVGRCWGHHFRCHLASLCSQYIGLTAPP